MGIVIWTHFLLSNMLWIKVAYCNSFDLGCSCSVKENIIFCQGDTGNELETIDQLIEVITSFGSDLAVLIANTTELQFIDYPTLTFIDFSGDESGLFHKLTRLLIQNTGISSIPIKAFERLDNLKVIELISNRNYKRVDWSSFIECDSCLSLTIKDIDLICDSNLMWLFNETLKREPVNLITLPMGVSNYPMTVWQHYKLPKQVHLLNYIVHDKDGQTTSKSECLKHLDKTIVIPKLEVNYGMVADSGDTEIRKTCDINGSIVLEAKLGGFEDKDTETDIYNFHEGNNDTETNLYNFEGNDTETSSSAIDVIALKRLRNGVNYTNLIKTLTKRKLMIQNLRQEDNNWIFFRVNNSSVSPIPMVKAAPLMIHAAPLIMNLLDQPKSERTIYCHFLVKVYPPYKNLSFIYTNEDGVERKILDNSTSGMEFVSWDEHKPTPDAFSELAVTLTIPMVVMYHPLVSYQMTICNVIGCASKICHIQKNTSNLNLAYPIVYPSVPASTNQTSVIATIVCIAFAAVICMLGIIVGYYMLKYKAKKRQFRSSREEFQLLDISPAHFIENSVYASTDRSPNPPRLNFLEDVTFMSSSVLRLIEAVGEGAFGQVFLVKCPTICISPNYYEPASASFDLTKTVSTESHYAAKCLTINSPENLESLRHEAGNLAKFDHKNIVKFEGVFRTEELNKIYLLFEFMQFGSLRTFLHELKPGAGLCGKEPFEDAVCILAWKKAVGLGPNQKTPQSLNLKDLLSIAHQIAEGLVYLTDNHFIHRDLAARNCLVGFDLLVKIGDFGMSKDLYMDNYYKTGGHQMLPVRWLPPEALMYGRYTQVTDVWSYGVVLWEIFTFGQQPWYFCSNKEVIDNVEHGQMLESPKNCPKILYDIMKSCWTFDHAKRPTARDVFKQLSKYKENCPLQDINRFT